MVVWEFLSRLFKYGLFGTCQGTVRLVHSVQALGGDGLETVNPFSFTVVSEYLSWWAIARCFDEVYNVDVDVIDAIVCGTQKVSPNGVTALVRFRCSDFCSFFLPFIGICMDKVHLESVHKSVFGLSHILKFAGFAGYAIN